jgi:hypothetical protein
LVRRRASGILGAVRPALRALALAFAALAATEAPSRAHAGDVPDGLDAKQWKEWTALVDEWFSAEDDGAKLLVE